MESQYTLTSLNQHIKQALQSAFPAQVWLVAEIAEMKVNRTGHCYLELVEKNTVDDEVTARARATIWSWQFRFIQPYFESSTGTALRAGIKVLLSASVEFHEVYGISLNIKDIDPSYTLGDMARKRKEIIEQLTNEGVIDMNKELELADIPGRIAIISSATAAGYEDFMKQLHQNPASYSFYTRLFEASMQGTDSPNSIMTALDTIFDIAFMFDVVVIIRGGGSQLDLACFDHYELALNIAQFPIPVLTGIGHEKDESIADLVAHTRLKTPTAVAEFLIGRFDIVANEVDWAFGQIKALSQQIIETEQNRLLAATRMFKPLVNNNIGESDTRLQLVQKELKPAVRAYVERTNSTNHYLKNRLGLIVPKLVGDLNRNLGLLQSEMQFRSQQYLHGQDINLGHLKSDLKRRTALFMNNKMQSVTWQMKAADILDPVNILKRGYSITLFQGKPLKDSECIVTGSVVETRLLKGRIYSEVITKR